MEEGNVGTKRKSPKVLTTISTGVCVHSCLSEVLYYSE